MSEDLEIKRGEEFEVLIDYDLFDLNIKGLNGLYLQADARSGKYLLHFFENGEYAEVDPEDLKRVKPGFIPEKNIEFASRVKTLEYSFET